MSKFQSPDYYAADSLLSEDEILVRGTVRDFVDDNVLPVIEKHNRAGTFPLHLVKRMAELGLFGATLPAKYGCEPKKLAHKKPAKSRTKNCTALKIARASSSV